MSVPRARRHKVTGYSNEQQSSAVQRGMKAAEQVRERWLTSLVEGETTFAVLVDRSRRSDDDRHLSKLRLVKILSSRRDWTRATAELALTRNGFTLTDTVESIRRSQRKVDLFADVLASTAERWRARPEPPKGWPWNGKLELLVPTESLPPQLGGPPPPAPAFPTRSTSTGFAPATASASRSRGEQQMAASTVMDDFLAELDSDDSPDAAADVEESPDAAALLFGDDDEDDDGDDEDWA